MIPKENNQLFPIFLKLENRNVLIIGGGKIALEKVNALLLNSNKANITIVGEEISNEIKTIASSYSNIKLKERKYSEEDIDKNDLVIAAVNNLHTSEQISIYAKQKGILVNIADKPELCDFYLGSIVKKGNLKIAISTNGKSPTIAKRIKEVLSDVFPDELEQVLENLHSIRKNLSGDFASKVRKLNEVTKILNTKQLSE